jgi:hypothetical protein
MARMQQVKAAIGEDHLPPIAFLSPKLENRFVQTQDSAAQPNALSFRASLTVCAVSVYHAVLGLPFSVAADPLPTPR